MIYLIHGKNIPDSRKFLSKLKSNYSDILELDHKKLLKGELQKKVLEKSSFLFGGKSAIVLENFNGNWEEIPRSSPTDIILWVSEKLEAPPNTKAFLFDLFPQNSVFKLADAIFYKREKEAYAQLEQLIISKVPTEQIVGIIGRSLTMLLLSKEGELQGMQEFVKKRVQEQSRLWSNGALKKALVELLKVDVSSKEGAKPQILLTAFISKVAGS